MIRSVIFFLLCFITLHTSAQSFGTDTPVITDSLMEGYNPVLSVAHNGWVYAGFNSHFDFSSFYGVYVSKDQGNTWQPLFQTEVFPSSAYHPVIQDIEVTGDDSLQLHLFVAYIAAGSASPLTIAYVNEYDGRTGALTGNTLSIGDGFTYGIADIAITSDDDFHSSLSSPFSIAVVYSEISQGGIDSVIALISADGAWLFGSPQLIDTSHGEFHDVDIAYGYSSTQIPGGILAVGFLRDKHLGCSVPNGTILSAFSSPVYLDSLSSPNINNCYGFSLSTQKGNDVNAQNSITVLLAANMNQSLYGYYSLNAGASGTWNYAVIDNNPQHFPTIPSVEYDFVRKQFLATWYSGDNEQNNYLSCALSDVSDFSNWNVFETNYCDTPQHLYGQNESDPEICLDPDRGLLYTAWSEYDQSIQPHSGHLRVMTDHSSIPVGLDEFFTNESLMVFPNPVLDEINIQSTQWSFSKLRYTITSADGRTVNNGSFSLNFGMNKKLPLSTLPAGIYFIQWESENEKFNTKLIKL
ncbi:MAG TPA: T9SS type A sorting domain-containing protein [Bacteroidia bacterium]|nr:T9SS type A sorting domain-containing protein [Bacteroidia bacterium]